MKEKKKVEVKAPKGKTSVCERAVKEAVKKVVADRKESATKKDSKTSGAKNVKNDNPVVKSKKSEPKSGKK